MTLLAFIAGMVTGILMLMAAIAWSLGADEGER